jgi:hypothetical protein
VGTSKTRKLFRRALLIVLTIAIAVMLYFGLGSGDRVIARDVGADGVGHVALLSRSYTIDRLYQSMQGPSGQHDALRLVEEGGPQLLWISGISSKLVGDDGAAQRPQEFFCHSNLAFTRKSDAGEADPRGRTPSAEGRLFTLIPGRLDIKLPEGFGLPVFSDEPLDYFTMSLNLNHRGEPVKLRFRTDISYVRGSDMKSIKPLFRRALYAYEPIGKASSHAMCMGGEDSCGPFVGKAASNAFHASLGKTNTVHWLIPPGDFESRVNVTDQFDLPYDTTAHYVTAHLHPYGKSIALFDKTSKQTLFTIRATDYPDRLGVQMMEQWSSTAGAEVIKGHEYELLTEYHNPTDKPIDAMSILYVYAQDRKFSGGS